MELEAQKGPCLETVRALHQTVVALRAALEESRTEILELKAKSWPLDSVEEALKNLAIENHVLRNKLVENKENETSGLNEARQKSTKFEAKICIKSLNKLSTSLESLTVLKSSDLKKLSFSKTVSFSNLSTIVDREIKMNGNNLEDSSGQAPQDLDQDQEVDDIELIFTTDDTKDSDFKEQLVSIETPETANLLQVSELDQNLDISDRELDDDVFNDNYETQDFFRRENSQLYNSKSDNSINQEKSLKSCYSYQDSSFENKSLEKDESFDRFEEKVRIVETDISKCGIQDVEYGGARRNTCPNPLQYRPLLHREALSKGLGSRKTRPILAHSNAIRRDSGAQTDISALPGSAWLSESNLVHKGRGENFPTTLPSKFPLPGSRLRLSEKTVEARRVLLSDIGFTSMVPELSRSADHLFPDAKPPVAANYGQFLKTGDYQTTGFTSQRFTWATTMATPTDSYSQSQFNSMYPLPSPPAPSRRCSAPVSPSRRALLKPATSRVRFANGSLPELRGDWTLTMDSGDSTDSLVEEAENYLRRSIDCILTTRDYYSDSSKKIGGRRASAPEPSGDNVPPPGWQPFLPRVPRDLKPDHWVKVITPEGRVRGGRVRYIGPVVCQTDQFVGVQLATPDGYTDGTFTSRRYFQCEPYHGIFVPFKKVIMGWRP